MDKPITFNKEEVKDKVLSTCSQFIDENISLIVKSTKGPELETDELLGKIIRLGQKAESGDMLAGLELGVLTTLMQTIMDK